MKIGQVTFEDADGNVLDSYTIDADDLATDDAQDEAGIMIRDMFHTNVPYLQDFAANR